MRIAPSALLAPAMLEALASQIGNQASALPPTELPVGQDTVYLCAADASGQMVSFIQSNYLGFGSGIVIPGTGISLQNRGCGFSTDPQHPNCIGPGKRPFHTIIPGFVTQQTAQESAAKMAFGVMGGHMQHQGHVQMVTRIFDHQQNPQAASDAPRWHVHPDFSISLEPGIDERVQQDLAQRGHAVAIRSEHGLYGGAQLIYKDIDGYIGASDHRKEGQAAGF